ncbi:MAG: DNA polymerase I, partial [Candidatus Cloacimonetes bacterium]|nr:DNA polymerase I [Candidatus Cloacimonadota bacterium]
MPEREKLFLIDGTAIIYRAHFAFIRNPLINSKGEHTSALFGTINSFLKLVDDFSPKHLFITFDRKEPTFRKKISEEYKATRPPMPGELVSQLKPIYEFFDEIGIVNCSKAGFEADDVISTLATIYQDRYEIVIVTGDKDFAQIVNDNIKLYDPFKAKMTDADAVLEKFGVAPEKFLDFLALMGDSADNIPGVKGIGKKGAATLLNQFGSLDEIYSHIGEISSKSIKSKLTENKKNAYLSRKLAEIITDVELEIASEETFAFHPETMHNGLVLLDEYELPSLWKKIISMNVEIDFDFSDKSPYNKESTYYKAITIDNETTFNELLIKLREHKIVAIDTETDNINSLVANLVGISLCFNEQEAYYLPLRHRMYD